jgi:hypothetical protein
MGGSSFNTSINSIYEIHQLFARALPEKSMDDWSPSSYDGFEAIDAANHYFTDRHDATSELQVQFKNSVDPDQLLETAAEEQFIHTAENEVEYYEAKNMEDGSIRWA